jgi:hypothetical protein
MSRLFIAFMMVILVLGFVLSLAAQAQQSIGGQDETTENHKGAQWAAGALATPGTGPVVAGTHLLITEVGWRGLNGACADSTEFVEIYNPTASTVDLSKYYLSDVNGYSDLPTQGTIDILAAGSDFAMRFPTGSTIPPGGYKVIAIQGPRYKRCTGLDADFMMWFAGCTPPCNLTTAVPMVDVARNKPGTYPTYGSFTNTAEFVRLFFWDDISDLVCDVDLVYWGSSPGTGNWPTLKTNAMCQDGPDAGGLLSCYINDVGNPAGSFGQALTTPASGAGTRQRVTAEGAENANGNGCMPGGPTAVEFTTWGHIKVLYR